MKPKFSFGERGVSFNRNGDISYMRYYETNFLCYEQSLISKIREKGYYVYALRDQQRNHYTIEKKVYVDNIGFIVTDDPIPLKISGDYEYITDTEFASLGWEESHSIRSIIQETKKELSEELLSAKLEWKQRELLREQEIKRIRESYNKR